MVSMRLCLSLAAALFGIFQAGGAQEGERHSSWHIQGELTEACTCNVPCTCNFGEGPSPHDYCWAMWSYWVKQGRFNDIDLAGVRIGGVEGEGGTLGLLDAQATPQQLPAMKQIWHALSGRLLCHVRLWPFKAGPGSLEPESPRQGAIIRTRYADRKFLGFELVEIEQVITGKGVKLRFGYRGGFEANYIFGRDPTRPITVRNIVSWPISESIKGRTVYFRYKDQFNDLDYRGTNSNQGPFNLTNRDAGAQAMTAPR
ncbi:MAG: DUF1326 domain-containing protein [Acidobacteriota bacterium]